MMTVSRLLMRNSNYKTIPNSSFTPLKSNIDNNDLYNKKIMSFTDRYFFKYNDNNNSPYTKKRPTSCILRKKNESNFYKKLNTNNYYKINEQLKNHLLKERKEANRKFLIKNYKLTFDLFNSANNSKEINEEYKFNLKKCSAMKVLNASRKCIGINYEQINNLTKMATEKKKNRIKSTKFSLDFNKKSINFFNKKKINFNKSNHIQNNRNIEEPIILKSFRYKNNSCDMRIDKNSNFNDKKNSMREKNIKNIKQKILDKTHPKEKKRLLSPKEKRRDVKNRQSSPLKIIEKDKSFLDIYEATLDKSPKKSKNFEKNLDIINIL